MGYLVKIMESVPHTAHARYYCDLVRDSFVRREAQQLGLSLAESLQSPSTDVLDALRGVFQKLRDLGQVLKKP